MSHSHDQAVHNGCLDFFGTIDIILHTPALYIGVGSDGFEGPGTGKQLTQTDDETGHWQ